MNSNEVFYWVASFGIAIFVGVWVFLAFQITKTLKSLSKVLEDVGDTTGDINDLKNAVKQGVFSLGSFLTKRSWKGGVFNGKRKKKFS